MSDNSTYEALRHLADSWGLVVMGLIFVGLCAWPFRPGARGANAAAAAMILHDDEFGDDDNG